MLRKRLYLKNLGLQFFYNLNLLRLVKSSSLISISYNYLTNNIRSSLTSKFLISADILVKGLNYKFVKTLKSKNQKYVFIDLTLKVDIFKLLMFMSFKNKKQSRLQYLLAPNSVTYESFTDNDEFNKITNIEFNKNFLITGYLIELKELLKNEGYSEIYNLGDWKILIKNN